MNKRRSDRIEGTRWNCEACGHQGFVSHAPKAGGWEVAQAVADHHRHLSPDCVTGIRRVRVRLVRTPK